MSAKRNKLAECLRVIDALLKPDEVATLRPPATAKATARLAKALGTAIPKDLATWFAWHDGQRESALGIDPKSPAIDLLSIETALTERKLLDADSEKMLPWSDRWLPFATNHGGDFYVYVTRGRGAGRILFYLHDAKRRPIIARDLAAFAAGIGNRLRARARPPAVQFGAPLEPLAPCDAPSLADIAVAPIGTLYYRRAFPYGSYGYAIYVRVSKSMWMKISAKQRGRRVATQYPLHAALAEISKRLANPRSILKMTPAALVQVLADDNIWPTGLSMLEGRDPRKDPYFVRLRTCLAVQ